MTPTLVEKQYRIAEGENDTFRGWLLRCETQTRKSGERALSLLEPTATTPSFLCTTKHAHFTKEQVSFFTVSSSPAPLNPLSPHPHRVSTGTPETVNAPPCRTASRVPTRSLPVKAARRHKSVPKSLERVPNVLETFASISNPRKAHRELQRVPRQEQRWEESSE